MKRLILKIRQQLLLLIDIPNQILIWVIWKLKKFNIEESIVIFSESRGGSTWLMEILSSIPGSCVNWEPLNNLKGIVPKKYRFGSRPYLPYNDTNNEYLSLITKILSYSTSKVWSRKHLTVSNISNSNFVITKFVRANLLAPYLLENFKFEKKPIFLIRHPIDTCISQINTFKNKKWVRSIEDIPDVVNNERYKSNIEFLSKLETNLEVCIANWCLNNLPTIKNYNVLNKMTVIFYYDLIIDPLTEIEMISDNLGLNKTQKSAFKSIDFRKPSFSSVKNKLKRNPIEQLNKNFKYLDINEKDNIQKIFDYFDFKLFDAYSPEPKKQFL